MTTIHPTCVLVLEAKERIFYANIENNPTAGALKARLNSEPLTVDLTDCGDRLSAPMPWDLPEAAAEIITKPGDIILSRGELVLCLDEAAIGGALLARIEYVPKDELKAAFSGARVKMWLEWGE